MFAKEAKEEKSAFPRGPNLERAYCLGKAGETEKALAIYREGIRRFPEEYTFHQGLAKLWLETRDAAKALPEARAAVRYSYGNQRYKALTTLARAYEMLGKPEEGVAAIDAELQGQLPEDATQSTRRARERLKAKADELRKKAAATSG